MGWGWPGGDSGNLRVAGSARRLRPAPARQEYETALSLDPSSAEVRNALAAIAREEGREEDALLLFRESLRLRPDQPEVRRETEELERKRAPGGGPAAVRPGGV